MPCYRSDSPYRLQQTSTESKDIAFDVGELPDEASRARQPRTGVTLTKAEVASVVSQFRNNSHNSPYNEGGLT